MYRSEYNNLSNKNNKFTKQCRKCNLVSIKKHFNYIG